MIASVGQQPHLGAGTVLGRRSAFHHGERAPGSLHPVLAFRPARAAPALERAFHETYGLEISDLFLGEDLAIATFRHAVGTTIPNVTKVAWDKKQDQIQKTTPGMLREK